MSGHKEPYHTMPWVANRILLPDTGRCDLSCNVWKPGLDLMSETQFSRLDWRPSKQRSTYPRVRDWGGQKQANPAFLEAGRRYGLGSPGNNRRCCRDDCNGFAVRESEYCRRHGGGRAAAFARPYVIGANWAKRLATGFRHRPAAVEAVEAVEASDTGRSSP